MQKSNSHQMAAGGDFFQASSLNFKIKTAAN